ncbi:DUF4752 family protein, partial [Salmonella enterica subsp. enterica serovar Kottbus]|nr:DUF4752 family protein [Salmonella enterica subsp. enterica serovar Kottbus]
GGCAMIDRIYTVLMVGLCLLGWLYIIAKAWDWFVGIAFQRFKPVASAAISLNT